MEEEGLGLEGVGEGPQPVVEEEAGEHFQSSEKKQNKDTTQYMNKKKGREVPLNWVLVCQCENFHFSQFLLF